MSLREVAVTDEHDGERLDVLLAPVCGSRARAQRAIDAGAVRVDGARAPKRLAVRSGQIVSLDPAALDRPAPAVRGDAPEVDMRFEDEHLLVVDKPAGLVVHAGAGVHGPTLVDALAGHAGGGEPERPGIVHRLDRDTSGLLLVARDAAGHRVLQEAIRRREVRREYLALVDGRPDARSGRIDAPIGRDRRHRTRMALDADGGRHAVTHFAVEEALARTTLLRVTLETGRTHQIRVHLGAIGLPVCGDPEYGRPGRLGLERQFLHAVRLSFAHPASGEPMSITAPLPSDLAGALDRARAEG